MKNFMMVLLLVCGVFHVTSLPGTTLETNKVTYATAADGSLSHIAVYSDGIVGTIIANAHNVGTQGIMSPDGNVIMYASSYKKKKNKLIHTYPWGTITSWENKQVMERK